MDKIKQITIEDNEEYLRQKSEPVKFPDKDLTKNIELMEEYFKQNSICLALASVQLEIPKRLIYLRNTNIDLINKYNNNELTLEENGYNEGRILINPVVISKKGLTEYWEACASCLDYVGHVYRPYKIVIEYYDVEGKKIKETFEGFESTVLSHELDHLDGILHIDIADEILVLSDEERKEFRKTHEYNILNKNGNYDELLNKMKS